MLLALGARTHARNRAWRDEATLFAAAVRVCPNSARAQFAHARHLAARGEIDRALAALGRAIAIVPPRAPADTRLGALRIRALFERARLLRGRGRPEAALADLEAILASPAGQGRSVGEVPRYLHVVLEHAALARTSGEHERARAGYRRVLRLLEQARGGEEGARALTPEAAARFALEARLQLAELALADHAPDRAERWLREAAGEQPSALRARAWFAWARLLARTGREREALARYEQLVDTFTDAAATGDVHARELVARALYRRAELLVRRGRFEQTREALERALRLDDDFAAARFSLADTLCALGRFERARRELERLRARYPEDRRVRAKLAELAILERARVQTHTRPPARPRPRPRPRGPGSHAANTRAHARRLVAMAYRAWREGRYDGALAALEAAAEADPAWSEPWRRRGEVLLGSNRAEQAVAAFEAALERTPPPDAALWLRLGEARELAGNTAGARAAWRRGVADARSRAETAGTQALAHMTAFRFGEAARALAQRRRWVALAKRLHAALAKPAATGTDRPH